MLDFFKIKAFLHMKIFVNLHIYFSSYSLWFFTMKSVMISWKKLWNHSFLLWISLWFSLWNLFVPSITYMPYIRLRKPLYTPSLLEFYYKWMLLFSCQVISDSVTPINCSTPGLPVPHHLPKFAQFHVHCISDPIQPSHPDTFLMFIT